MTSITQLLDDKGERRSPTDQVLLRFHSSCNTAIANPGTLHPLHSCATLVEGITTSPHHAVPFEFVITNSARCPR